MHNLRGKDEYLVPVTERRMENIHNNVNYWILEVEQEKSLSIPKLFAFPTSNITDGIVTSE